MPDERSVESMRALFKCTKLESSYSVETLQALRFSEDLCSDEYKLFEVDSSLAAKLTVPGSRSVIELKDEPKRNNTDGKVFACTDKQTYSILEAETSNSLLLTSNWWLPGEKKSDMKVTSAGNVTVLVPTVVAVKKTYFEFNKVPSPSLHLLWKFLRTSTFYGPLDDGFDNKDESGGRTTNCFTHSDLTERFPCSPFELTDAFTRLRICEIDGYMRLIDAEYLNQVLRDIFSCADENAWNWRTQGFCLSNVLSNLSEMHEPTLLTQVMSYFFMRRHSPTVHCASSFKDRALFPRTSRICQVIGEHLLSVTSSFDFTDFLAVWRATVPEGIRPHIRRHLTCAGRAYCQTVTTATATGHNELSFRSISLLRSEELPDDSVETRLCALFQRCSLWPEDELASYLNELVLVEKQNDVGTELSGETELENDGEFDYTSLSGDDLLLVPNDDEHNLHRPIHPNVAIFLNRYCRVANCLGPQGCRVYIQKHATM